MASPTRRLRALFHSILAVTVPTTAAGCASISVEGFEPLQCGNNETPEFLTGLVIDPPVDFLQLRSVGLDGGDGSEQQIGTPCATATDKAACEAKLNGTLPTPGFQFGQCVQVCPEFVLVVNRGDDVTFVSTVDGARALLGVIDSPADAVFRAKLEGYSVRCDLVDEGGVRAVDGGYEVLATKITSGCHPVEETLYRLFVTSEGNVSALESEVISSESGVCIGRRPAGLSARRGTGRTRLGAYWSDVAQLEAASVHAFAALERELAAHGAPAGLVQRARRSKQDEVRHAAVTRRLAARHGGAARKLKVERRPIRSLEAIAIENAAEGCVRETFGALIGSYQARTAADPSVREAMQKIAEDETRHAGLAWAVDAWIQTRLSPEARGRVEAARRQALAELLEGAEKGPHAELVAGAGLPEAKVAVELARRFCAAVAG